jgi:proteasome accessory factor B
MSARRTERLLNLVICLLATRTWLTKDQIRHAVPQYQDCDRDDAFERMFERDKDDLRELGIPIVTGTRSSLFEDEVGYRIPPESYRLPPVDLTAEELTVLGLASRVWQQASLAGPAAQALVKLQALGVQTDADSLVGIEPRVRTAEPAFQPLYAATRDRAPVAFDYNKSGPWTGEAPRGASPGEPVDRPGVQARHVEPWRLISRRGHWYVVGHDRDRGERRTFRLSRISGAVRRIGPPGAYEVPPAETTTDGAARPADADLGFDRSQNRTDDRLATIRVREGHAWSLRRRALEVEAAVDGSPGASWDEVRVRVGDVEELSAEIAWLGPHAVVLGPADLRDLVIRRLRGAARAHRDDRHDDERQPDGPHPDGVRA